MKKFLATILVSLMVFGNVAVLTTPQRAQAFLGFGDISFDPPVLLANLKDLALKIGESALKRLANKVLNKMLKKTVNWAITGFGPWEDGANAAGQPFYVQNKDSLIKNIEDQALLSTIQSLEDTCSGSACPYAKDLTRNLVKNTINESKNRLPIFNLDKYSPDWKIFVDATTPNSFSQGGGWSTWEGMNSNPQNTPFGAYLTTTTAVKEKKTVAVTKQENELTQNGGFLSLRKCVAYAPGKEGSSEIDFTKFTSGGTSSTGTTSTAPTGGIPFGGGPDMCPNIEGYQATIPSNTIKDINGNCVDNSVDKYNFKNKYSKGAKVKYLNNIFEAQRDTTGDPPPVGQSDSTFWKFIEGDKTAAGQALGEIGDAFANTYALPGLVVDNCIRYETVTPGSMAKEMLGKTLTAGIDKSIADSSTGNSIVDSLVDMAAVFITNGLDKMLTKATTKTTDQKIFAGGIGNEDTIALGVGNGVNRNSPYYSEDGKTEIIIQDPYDPTKLHPDLLEGMETTQLEVAELEILLEKLRSLPESYKQLDICLPGPDLGWEKRSKDEYTRSAKRLEKKSNKNNQDKAEDAQEALNRREKFFNKEISTTKIRMLTVIPSAIPIMSKLSQITTTSSELKSAEKKYSNRVGALATLQAVQSALASGNLDPLTLVTLKKQFAGIKSSVSTEETLTDTVSDKEIVLSDINVSFNKSNPKSLISKCTEERKLLADGVIGEDLGENLFCEWQYHEPDGEIVTSTYDPGRSVPRMVGTGYTQDQKPFDNGNNVRFEFDCDQMYRATDSYYEDLQ